MKNHEGQSRREFLSQTAIAAGVAAMAGHALGAEPNIRQGRVPKAAARVPTKAGEPVRIGVIGTGGMGTGHCQAIANLTKEGRTNVDIVALADVNDLRVAAAKRWLDENQSFTVDTYRDYTQLLERGDIHAVLIASPEHWHAQHVVDAIAAGKDVYCEKPMTLNLEDAMWVFRAAQANPDIVVQVGTQKMQLPKFHAARDIIAKGGIGTPTFCQTSYCRNSRDGEWLYYAIDPNWEPGVNLDWEGWCGNQGRAPWDPAVYARWRRYRKYSTGIIGDLLVHEMTPMMFALGMGWPTRVCATGAHMIDKAMENHDLININAQFGTGCTMTVAGSTCNELGLETLIRGHKGNIYLNGRHCVVRPERLYVDEIEDQTVECEDIGNDQDMHRVKWVQAIRSREQPASGVELAAKVMVIVDLATRAIWDGHAYEFDPERLQARRV